MLRCVAVCCSVLQFVADVLQCVLLGFKEESFAEELQCAADVLQCVAVCCSVLQCVRL